MTESLAYQQHPKPNKRLGYLNLLTFILIALGVILLAGGALYYVYSWNSKAELDSLGVSMPIVSNVTPNEQLGALGIDPEVSELISTFETVSMDSLPPIGTLSDTTRISVPSVEIDSPVRELLILNLGDSQAYQTPNKVVGHIPSTAAGGEMGTVWLFGHLESPIRDEGSVFSTLPEIPDLLRQGLDVHAILWNDENAYLYKLNSSEVVHQDDLNLEDKGTASIALVTCIPRWVYDYRLIISGELIGTKKVAQS